MSNRERHEGLSGAAGELDGISCLVAMDTCIARLDLSQTRQSP